MTKTMVRLLLAGAVLAAAATTVRAADAYYPVSRIDTGAGYAVVAVQRARPDAGRCEAANKRFVDQLLASCEACKLRRMECTTRLAPEEEAAIGGKAVKHFSVAARGIRIMFIGRLRDAGLACRQIARQTSEKGRTARCLSPGQEV